MSETGFEARAKKIIATKNEKYSLWDLVHNSRALNQFVPKAQRGFWVRSIRAMDDEKLQKACDLLYEEVKKHVLIDLEREDRTEEIITKVAKEATTNLKKGKRTMVKKVEEASRESELKEGEKILDDL